MECIICYDNGTEQLQDNTYCACKYKIHNSCWTKYVSSSKNATITCPICRVDIISQPIQYVIQRPINAPGDVVIIINQPNLVQGRDISAKLCAAGVCLSLLILALVLIWK